MVKVTITLKLKSVSGAKGQGHYNLKTENNVQSIT
jgi:hypothetical protein